MAKKILLAEDSKTMQKVIQMTFAAEDVTVTVASSADEAIKRAQEWIPDIVIADLSMGSKNGYDISAAVKANSALSHTAVLLLHGSAAPYDQVKGAASKADGEILKPFDSQAMIDKVNSLLAVAPKPRKKAMEPARSLTSPTEMSEGDIVIDTEFMTQKDTVPKQPIAPSFSVRPTPTPPKIPPQHRAGAHPIPNRPSSPGLPVVPPKPQSRPAKPVQPEVSPVRPWPTTTSPNAFAKPPSSTPVPPVVEITIEAEPPPDPLEVGGAANELPSFESPVNQPISVIPKISEAKDVTLIGVEQPALGFKSDLPPPPPGMPLPSHLPTGPKPDPFEPPAAASRRLGQRERPMPAKPIPAAKPKPSKAQRVTKPLGQVPPGEVSLPDGIDEKVAMEVITKLSQQVIEKIVWEIVPDLAERIIREEVERLVEKRKS